MRRVEQLIRQVRRQTENQLASGTSAGSNDGISDEEFIQYLNDAQERIYTMIVKTHEKAFIKEDFIDLVSGTEKYALPTDILAEQQIVNIEYSFTGTPDEYVPLRKGYHIERTSFSGFPSMYISFSDQVIINPIADKSQTSGLRVTYHPLLRRIDKRRSTVDSVTLDTSARTITELNLSVDGPVTFTEEDFDEYDSLCIVNARGAQQMIRIPYTDVSAAGVVSVDSSFVYELGETISPGDYVVLGDNASTHSQLPDILEKYLLAYCAWKIFKRDSTVDSAEQLQELVSMEQDLVDLFAENSSDVDRIPVINSEFIW